jgi:ATP-dependent HslUV protease ATP-binding subunit HslU
MAIYLPGTADDQALSLDEMTPREVVAELDKYVVGQAAAKRAVAVALRNRTRRQRLTPELADEIMPKNILMIGSTGVGKTEIARRLAKLTGSPFLKVEASKFTEVGYVGRDVESIVRDLVENPIDMVREEKLDEVEDRAELAAEERLVELLVAQGVGGQPTLADDTVVGEGGAPEGGGGSTQVSEARPGAPASAERERVLRELREGKLDELMVEVEARDRPMPQVEVFGNFPPDEMEGPKDSNNRMDVGSLKDALAGIFGQQKRKRSMKVADAFEYLSQEEEGRLLDMDQVVRVAVERVEDAGIVFLDEIDKIAGREGGHGPEISREGVQRDILPIVEGTSVSTKYGMVSTDHILFIAAGAFHVSKPSDLIPELQGRFPIRVELHALTVEDFLRILTEPKSSLVKQAVALLETEGLKLEFAPEALEEMARFAFQVNESTENIGARRLHTILEKVLEEISFVAPELGKASGDVAATETMPGVVVRAASSPTRDDTTVAGGAPGVERVLVVDRAYVQKQVAGIVKNQDLSRYIL